MSTGNGQSILLPDGRRPRLLCAVTSALSTVFFRGRARYLREQGFEVHVVSSPGDRLEEIGRSEGVTIHALTVQRQPAPLADIVSLLRVYRLLRRLKPDIVDASTPKASLLFGLASALSGVRCRVYSLWGLRLETPTGLLRWLLTLTERITAACAHRVACISPSLRQRAIELRLTAPDKLVVIGSGSVKGVSVERFASSPAIRQRADRLKQELGIQPGTPVIGFAGRLVRDKGIAELVDAFFRLKPRFPSLRLLLLGAFEDGDPLDPAVRRLMETTPEIITPGHVEDIVPYYHLMDVLALPTYREGFGEVALEAAAAGKPVVTTDATGARDSIVDKATGFIVPVGNAEALAGAVARVLESPELARQMGEAGRRRAVADFQPERIWNELAELYRELLAERLK